MRRGELITVAISGDFGKPRPAVVIQSDKFQPYPSIVVAFVTSTLEDAPLVRVAVDPTPENGLEKPSQVTVDKLFTIPANKAGPVFGRLDDGGR